MTSPRNGRRPACSASDAEWDSIHAILVFDLAGDRSAANGCGDGLPPGPACRGGRGRHGRSGDRRGPGTVFRAGDRAGTGRACRPAGPTGRARRSRGSCTGCCRAASRRSVGSSPGSTVTLPPPGRHRSASVPTSGRSCPASTPFPAATSGVDGVRRVPAAARAHRQTAPAGACAPVVLARPDPCARPRPLAGRQHHRRRGAVPGSAGRWSWSRPTSSSTPPVAAPSPWRHWSPWAARGRRRPRSAWTSAMRPPPSTSPIGRATGRPCSPSGRHRASGSCGYLIPVEGNRWMACITQLHCQRPPAGPA